MKTLHHAERCQVLLEPDVKGVVVRAVRWRGVTWHVQTTLEVFVYWGEWWLHPDLQGETRDYYVLGTARGELTVFRRLHRDLEQQGWFVLGWWD
jgi:hypothetical protein